MPDLQPRHNTVVADAVRGHWADRLLPDWAKPYARLARWDRPIGWWLLLWPCWWSSLMATNAEHAAPNLWHLALFLVGAVAMRGAGCTWNDILDRDLDAKVARTRSRPLPSGQVTVAQAFAFLGAQAVVGLIVLLQFNPFTIALGAASLAIAAVYPLVKRVFDLPQLFLGLAFSWGALVGWSANYGGLGAPALLLFAGTVLWVIGYDTIYAHQDREDDALVGVRSSARLFGQGTRPALFALYAGALALWGGAFATAGLGPWAYVGLVAAAAHLAWQARALDIDDPAQCLMLFRTNRFTGWLVFMGLLIDALVRVMSGR